VQDNPNRPVLPLTFAIRLTANPALEFEVQVKVPVIVPGCATKGTFGCIPGTSVNSAESEPKI
jgi:hypothetical protein